MAAPVVSVIIPTRNRAELLRRSVHSVLTQSFADFELIVVDDASTDHTQEVLASFGDARIRVIKRGKNAGAAAARNVAISAARGKYLAFQDDDDFWLVQKLERQVAALEAAPADVGLCLCAFISLLRDQSFYVGGPERLGTMDYRKGGGTGGPSYWHMSTPAWLLKRETLDKVGGFDERLRCMDDWELGLRLSQVCRFIQIEQPLYIQDWRRSHTGMTFNELAQADDLAIMSEKHADFWRDHPRSQARHFFLTGKYYCIHKTPKDGLPWLLRSVKAWPFQAHGWVAVLAALGGAEAFAAARGFSVAVKRALHRVLQFRL